jgi:hypothetical protein
MIVVIHALAGSLARSCMYARIAIERTASVDDVDNVREMIAPKLCL